MISLTLFKSIFDNKTHRKMKFDSLESFEKLLYDLSKQPGYKPKKGEFKDGSPLISPATFQQETTRANRHLKKRLKHLKVIILFVIHLLLLRKKNQSLESFYHLKVKSKAIRLDISGMH
jgi:hypothetical protein